MKQYVKRLLPFLFLLLCLFCSPVSAAKTPGKVTGLKASTTNTTIKLTWKKASSAKKYAVYQVNKTTGEEKLLKKTSSISYSVKGTIDVTYYFKVCALDASGNAGAFSSVVSAKPSITPPPVPSSFRLKSRGDEYVTLKWKKLSSSSKASGYVIECYNDDTKTYEIVKTINNRSTVETRISKLNAGTTYKFRIKSFRKVSGKKYYSKASDVVSVKAVELSNAVKSIRAPYYTVKAKSNLKIKTGSGSTITLKKNSKLLVTSKNGKYVNGYTTSGQKLVNIKRSSLKYTGLDSSSKDYSTSVKEQFINYKGLSSSTNYFVWVSQYTYKTNIFKGSAGNWKLIKSYDCIVGRWQNRTASGLRKILKKTYYGSYGAPTLYFSSGTGTPSNPTGCAFHGYVDGNRTGARSHGCVRLSRSALVYMYNTLPVGTRVYIY